MLQTDVEGGNGATVEAFKMEDLSGSPELFLFLASTVHDMKNSISVVNGTLESLLAGAQERQGLRPEGVTPEGVTPEGATPEGTADDAAYPRMAQMLYQTKRLNDNLMQLLALYKQVGKPGYPFDARPQLVGQLVEQVVAQEKILLAARAITLHTSFPAELIWCFDEDLIIGVLGHAINNAYRYTRDTIRLSVAEVGDMLELRVEDNGDGFSPALIAAGAAAMDGASSGINFATNRTGLGLYFASEVAKMHRHRRRRGGIALENGGALGGGCFILRLP